MSSSENIYPTLYAVVSIPNEQIAEFETWIKTHNIKIYKKYDWYDRNTEIGVYYTFKVKGLRDSDILDWPSKIKEVTPPKNFKTNWLPLDLFLELKVESLMEDYQFYREYAEHETAAKYLNATNFLKEITSQQVKYLEHSARGMKKFISIQ